MTRKDYRLAANIVNSITVAKEQLVAYNLFVTLFCNYENFNKDKFRKACKLLID